LLKLHGVMRSSRELDEEAFFNPGNRPETVSINGISLKKGDLVRVRPKSRADIMDIAVAGKIAIIESIEQDAENKMHLALVLEDDPGRDLGMARQPGHRFFYSTDEVEPLEGECRRTPCDGLGKHPQSNSRYAIKIIRPIGLISPISPLQ
jgi:hypothetical protein